MHVERPRCRSRDSRAGATAQPPIVSHACLRPAQARGGTPPMELALVMHSFTRMIERPARCQQHGANRTGANQPTEAMHPLVPIGCGTSLLPRDDAPAQLKIGVHFTRKQLACEWGLPTAAIQHFPDGLRAKSVAGHLMKATARQNPKPRFKASARLSLVSHSVTCNHGINHRLVCDGAQKLLGHRNPHHRRCTAPCHQREEPTPKSSERASAGCDRAVDCGRGLHPLLSWANVEPEDVCQIRIAVQRACAIRGGGGSEVC